MDRASYEHLLARAERATAAHERRLLRDKLRHYQSAPWIDAELRQRFHAFCDRIGIPCVEAPLTTLNIGETWLLLYGRGHGSTLRLTAKANGSGRSSVFEQEAQRALLGLHAAAGSLGRRLPEAWPHFGVIGGAENLEIEGNSLGLSAVIAALSKATKRAPRAQTAGTAAIDREGKLSPVEHVTEKAAALRRQWPLVDRLVVAKEQVIESLPPGLRVERAATIQEACGFFDLQLENLTRAHFEDWIERLNFLIANETRAKTTAEWQEVSAEAWQIAKALSGDSHYQSQAQEARLYAAHFASHAGDDRASELIQQVPDEALLKFPDLRVRRLIFLAASAIDQPDAVALASQAVELCRDLDTKTHQELMGQALGTQGRAYLHGGKPVVAEPLLRAALEHHQIHRPQEWPRSACYLATCMRHAGRTEEALKRTQEALRETESRHGHRIAETTAHYLRLERGRCLAALGHTEDAIRDFRDVIAAQPSAASYPRLGAHRSIISALARLNSIEEAREHLSLCVEIARGRELATLRKVGAIAAGEALLSASPLLARHELEAVWRAWFTDPPARVIPQWIY